MRINHYKTRLNEDGAAILVKEASHNYGEANLRLDNPIRVYELCTEYLEMQRETEEYVYILCLNTKNRLIGLFELSHGASDCSMARGREIFQKALLLNAQNIIMVHNHPSGDATPSMEDDTVYRKLRQVGDLLEIRLLDSIIIGDNNYYSFKEKEM